MPAPLQPAPDWFDRFWEKNKSSLPLVLRTDSSKELARKLLQSAIDFGTLYAKNSPDALRQIIAFARIAAIMRGTVGVLDAPDPTPEQVAEAVEKLVARLKP